ncbi:hypothetical protein D3C77_270580 [compost metagenome]
MQKIEKNLNQAVLIGHDEREIARNPIAELERFALGHKLQHVDNGRSQAVNGDRSRLQLDTVFLKPAQIKQLIQHKGHMLSNRNKQIKILGAFVAQCIFLPLGYGL